jgi:predicted RNA binding protein YcfA (HicA-like mRNA interferase family)
MVKVGELIRLLQDQGWKLVRTKGSHRQFQHALRPGTVTVAGKPSADIPPGTLKSIFKQAGLNRKDLER